MKHFIISSILSLVFFIPSTVYSLYPYPSFVKNCTSATFDGVNLIVVDCSAQLNVPSNQLHTLGQYTSIINDNSTTPTVIANCFFNNCGNIHAKSPVLFQNVVFNNSKYIGDAVSNTGLGGAAVLVDNTTATFTNVSFLNGYARNAGGAVYITGTSGVGIFNNITAINNTAAAQLNQGGGAILVDSQSSANITNSNFFNNIAFRGGSIRINSGATVYITNTTFTAGKTYNSRGGDIHNEGGSLYWSGGASYGIYGGVHDNDQLQGASGGSVSMLGEGYSKIDSVYFEGQRVAYYGAVFYFYGGATADISNIVTMDTQANNLGGIAYLVDSGDQGPQVTCRNCSFANSYAVAGAGGFLISSLSNLTLTNVISENSTVPFLNDTAGGGGFLIGQDGSMSLLVNTTIMGANAVNGYGGAILLIGAATFNMINSSIQGATVGSDVLYSSGGGAIFAEFDSKVTPNKIPYLNVTNSTFINNVASTGGGIDCQNCRLDLNNVQFIGNNATSSAGALMLENWNWTTTATTLLGKIGFYNNRVLDPIYGVGGAIFMDTQAALIINTTDLTMDGNVAKGGSAIWNQDWYWSDSAVGALNYNPPANSPPSAQPNITVGQTIYFEKAKFANYIANNGGGYPAALSNGFDSPVVAVIPVNGTSQFNGLKTLNSNLYLPDLSFYLVNAFGTQSIYVVPWAYPVMRVTFTTSSGKILRTVYKGPASITDAIITLRDINLVGLQYPVDFNGTIIASFSILQQSDQSSSSRVVTTSFNIPACTTPNLLVAGTNPDGSPQYSENGKLQYVCVPGYKVSTAARDTIFSLSILMLALACGLAVFSHVHRRSKIYKVSSPFFTLVISMGCIFQLLSVSVQGFFSSASAFNCMAGVWLELIGFVLVGFSIILKTHRIRAIFIHTLKTRGRTDEITNEFLAYWMSFFVVIVIVFLAVWQSYSPLRVPSLDPSDSNYLLNAKAMQFGGNGGWVDTDLCVVPPNLTLNPVYNPYFIYPLVSVLIHLIVEFIAVCYAYSCRDVPTAYNDSKSNALISYAWLLSGGILYPIGEYASFSPDALYALKMLRIMIPVGLTLYLYHVPRAYLMLKDPRAAEKLASLGASSAASGGSASGTTKNGRGASSNINKRAVNSRLMAAGSNERLNKPVQWVSLGNLTPLDQEGGQLATSQESLASVSVDSRTGIMQATSRI